MKYVILLPDGAHDEPLPELGGRTPLQVAHTPHMDDVARSGRLGLTVTIPEGFTAGTDVGTMSLFGYDPHQYYSGRAPLEAAARGLQVRDDQMIFRCNFVTVLDGAMKDNTGGHITQEEADALIALLREHLSGDGCTFVSGVTYRNLMLLDDAADMKLRCAPPHDFIDAPVAGLLPSGTGAERVRSIMDRAEALLQAHPVNVRRREAGHPPVTGIWLWGQGRPTRFEPLSERFGLTGVCITAVDILRGLAVLMGLDLVHVPGATGWIDTDYAAKGRAALEALDRYDLVVVHVEAADEAAHMGRADEKVKALERMDAHIVGPILRRLRSLPEWRILVAADHPTLTRTRGHSPIPPLFAFAGTGIPAVEKRPFEEASAEAGGYRVIPGHDLLEIFLRG